MANCIMILGPTGTGKSTSIKTLNPQETLILNILKKRLPFKGSGQMYNTEKKNLFNIDNWADLTKILQAANGKFKNIIVDDMTYIMRKEYFARSKETGYNKYTDIGLHFQTIIQTCENLNPDMNVFFILHSEEVVSDGTIVTYKAATIGKLIDNQYNPVEVVPMVLFSSVIYDDQKHPTYGFYTHRCMKGNIEIPAKSPDGMFEEDFIPNDLAYVVKEINAYYE